MKFSLNTTIIKPENNVEVKSAVILLHGYGGDGKDISMLTLNWKRFLKNTVFLCPDAHEVCSINPVGFQWFDLNNEDPEYTLQESKKAENVLNSYISEVSNYFDLEYSKKISSFLSLVVAITIFFIFFNFFIRFTKTSSGVIPLNFIKVFPGNLLDPILA